MRSLAPVVCLLLGASSIASEVSGPHNDVEVKAALLFNFAKFVDWPDPHGPALTIGVLGDSTFPAILERMVRGKTLNGRPVQVKALERIPEARDCDMLFIADSSQRHWRAVLTAISGRSVLTVSDMADFVARGGIIGLFQDENRLRFEVNLTAATQARLQIRAQLLRLARVVGANVRKGGN